ncbi:MAG TPA: DUF1573 domain-containing protein [Microscillaceae bacterium]|nr:DUF1573 domain-containing protein [Microscillaceae bacterium]
MKKQLFILLALVVAVAGIFAFTTSNSSVGSKTVDGPKFKWDKKVHNFGKIKQGVPVETSFEFTNSGTAPLIITNVGTSCGCTVPKYPKEPVMPGQTKKIEVKYNAAAMGNFSKTITITSNAENPTTVLFIKGEVVKKNDVK